MRLLSNTAHVWWLDLADLPDTAWLDWRAVLDDEEAGRAARFLRETDRRSFIAAHVLLRVMLYHFTGMPPRGWRFVTGTHGKPALHPDHDLAELQFNISHTHGAVACGMVLDHPIGVDIEDEERAGAPMDIAEAYFAPSEIAALHAAPPSERGALFFHIWTLKEAYIKARGQGLSLALDRFAFSVSPIRISFEASTLDRPSHWQFESIACTSRHRLSIAIRPTTSVAVLPDRVTYSEIARLMDASRSGSASLGRGRETETPA